MSFGCTSSRGSSASNGWIMAERLRWRPRYCRGQGAMSTSTDRRIPSLDGLRAISISFVLLSAMTFGCVPLQADAGPLYGPVTWQGAVNLTVNGASVTKSGGCEGCPDAYAVSSSESAAQDIYLQFPAVMGKQMLVGFIPDGTPVRAGGMAYSSLFR